MRTYNIQQGSSEWLQLRATAFTASEAPAMMGCSPYMTRTELLRLKHVGIAQETTSAEQYLFDKGHATEAQFRPVAERIIGQDLYPVTGSIELDGMLLLASFDGLTVDDVHGYEHKLLSQTNLEALNQTGEPPIYHCWQMEQQLLVSGADDILFCTSDGTQENATTCLYTSKPERRAALIAGWKQFAADLATYVPSTVSVAPIAKTVASLPVVFDMRVEGKLIACNLAQYKPAALAYIEAINTELESDQSFADAEADAKFCRESADKLKLAIEQALGQMGDINEAIHTVRDIAAAFDAKGLKLEKLVKARKEELRQGIVQAASRAYNAHLEKLTARIGWVPVRSTLPDFAGAVKGKRNLASIQDAVDTELARAKIAANELADLMEANIKTLRGEAHDWGFLFPDLANVAGKPAEDFANLLAARIAAHKQVEEQRRQHEEQARQAQQAREAEAAAKAAEVVEKAAAPAAPAVATAAPVVAAPAPVVVGEAVATLKLGDINTRLAPIQVSAAGLAELGFNPVGKDKSAVLYRETDFPLMCAAIAGHATKAAARSLQAA